jgi:hypothetical protein
LEFSVELVINRILHIRSVEHVIGVSSLIEQAS